MSWKTIKDEGWSEERKFSSPSVKRLGKKTRKIAGKIAEKL